MNKIVPNRYQRSQNKKKLEKKWRELSKFITPKNTDNTNWENVTFDTQEFHLEWVISYIKWEEINILDRKSWNIIPSKLDENIPKTLWKQLVVGDIVYYVLVEWTWVVKYRRPREKFISRIRWDSNRFWALWEHEHIMVANVDVALIVAPAKNPDFHPSLVDRYLIICQNWGITPVICINKSDLTTKRHEILEWYKSFWIKIVETSTLNNQWIDILKDILKWKIWVLLWKSWVWKTSLVNALTGNLELKTGSVNVKSWEWKHTTTHTNLYNITENTYIIDTPWIRSLWVTQIGKNDLKYYFPEFKNFDWNCKYKDCFHIHEPQCWVKDAVTSWEINKYRYQSYLRIYEDLV